jgi:predicted nuclease of predicted toxin-antitoxin system
MRLLADENISPDLVSWLRDAGHDVVAVREVARGEPDPRVLELAEDEGRILLTEDKDFGDLVFRERLPATGIILLRFHTRTYTEYLQLFESFWPDIDRQASGCFIVATNEALRVRPLPGHE